MLQRLLGRDGVHPSSTRRDLPAVGPDEGAVAAPGAKLQVPGDPGDLQEMRPVVEVRGRAMPVAWQIGGLSVENEDLVVVFVRGCCGCRRDLASQPRRQLSD